MSKWPVQKQIQRTTQQHVDHQDATDIQKKTIFKTASSLVNTNVTQKR